MLLPAGRRRSARDLPVLASFLAGTVGGALTSGMFLWLLSGLGEPVDRRLRIGVLVLVGSFLWAVRHGPLDGHVRLPERRHQISSMVLSGSATRGARRFGFALGTGVRTYVPSGAPYVLAAALLLARPTALTAAVAATGFGAGRALPLLARFARPLPGAGTVVGRTVVDLSSRLAPLSVLAAGVALV